MKHVEESNNIWRINNIQCITLVVLYGQFMMHGQRNIKLYFVVFDGFISIIFCLLSRVVSLQGFVGPGMVCDVFPLGGVRCELRSHSLFTLCLRSERRHKSQSTQPRGQPSHTIPGPTKPCADTARDIQKTEARIIEYGTWLHTQFP